MAQGNTIHTRHIRTWSEYSKITQYSDAHITRQFNCEIAHFVKCEHNLQISRRKRLVGRCLRQF